jgi:hypothetical protein
MLSISSLFRIAASALARRSSCLARSSGDASSSAGSPPPYTCPSASTPIVGESSATGASAASVIARLTESDVSVIARLTESAEAISGELDEIASPAFGWLAMTISSVALDNDMSTGAWATTIGSAPTPSERSMRLM